MHRTQRQRLVEFIDKSQIKTRIMFTLLEEPMTAYQLSRRHMGNRKEYATACERLKDRNLILKKGTTSRGGSVYSINQRMLLSKFGLAPRREDIPKAMSIVRVVAIHVQKRFSGGVYSPFAKMASNMLKTRMRQ